MDTLRIYFDTNVLQYASYILKDKTFNDILVTGRSESFSQKTDNLGERWVNNVKALRFILDVDDQLPFIFLTSKLTLAEIQQAPQDKKERMFEFYEILLKYSNAQNWPRPPIPLPQPKRGTLAILRSILPHENDAKHAYFSMLRRCNVFMTCDYKSILNYRKELEMIGVNAKSPYDLVVSIYGKELWERGAGLAIIM